MTDIKTVLKPCPFCGANASVEAVGRDWWRVDADHDEACVFIYGRYEVPQTAAYLEGLVQDWNRRAVLAASSPAQEPVAWVRFRSDGGYEGPIMDSSREMCDIRRRSGAWTPLYAAPVDAQDMKDKNE